MSNAVIRYVIAFGGILAIAWSVRYAGSPSQGARVPASLHEEQDRTHMDPGAAIHTEKVQGPLITAIDPLNAAPASVGTPFVLVGTVITTKEVSNVHYQWNLPPGISFVSGDARGTLAHIAPGKPYISKITVRQDEPGNKQIHLTLAAGDEHYSFGSSAQYNSTAQGEINAKRASVKKVVPETIH